MGQQVARHFPDRLTFVIKNNGCLGNLNLVNLNTLRELKIEDNDSLETICFNLSPPLTNNEGATNSGTDAFSRSPSPGDLVLSTCPP